MGGALSTRVFVVTRFIGLGAPGDVGYLRGRKRPDESGHYERAPDWGIKLWALRDRAICRLALYDLYGKAVCEAQNADVVL